jgi:hypothetical protein
LRQFKDPHGCVEHECRARQDWRVCYDKWREEVDAALKPAEKNGRS